MMTRSRRHDLCLGASDDSDVCASHSLYYSSCFLLACFLAQIDAARWISSWTQSRLAVPVFAGVGRALQFALAEGHLSELQEMYAHWPFFRATIDIIEMVLSKSDPDIFHVYENDLVRSSHVEKSAA